MTAKFSKTRETIIEVSRNVFGEMGYYNATINDIALACNRGRRTIYTYFKSKDEIYNEVIKVESTKMAGELQNYFSNILDPHEKLRTYIIKRMEIIRNLVYAHTALKTCFFKEKAHFDQIRREFDKEEVKIVLSILDDGIRRSAFQIFNMSLTAHNLLVTLKAFENNFMDMNPDEALMQRQKDIIRVILSGIFNNNNNLR
jgi:AcrR family transcriptional regulator